MTTYLRPEHFGAKSDTAVLIEQLAAALALITPEGEYGAAVPDSAEVKIFATLTVAEVLHVRALISQVREYSDVR